MIGDAKEAQWAEEHSDVKICDDLEAKESRMVWSKQRKPTPVWC